MADFVCELLSSRAELEAPFPALSSGSGAVLDFRGVVREREDDRLIEGIEYEAHAEMAMHQLEKISEQAVARFRLHSAIVRHRIGFVAAGEASLLVRLTAAHRSESLEAMTWLINELKKRVPIWKHPRFNESKTEMRELAPEVAP